MIAQNPGNGFTIWITGMAGAGKRSLAREVATLLQELGKPVEVLDAPHWAEFLSMGPGDSIEERMEVVRRAGVVAKALTKAGGYVIVPMVSPYRESRDALRKDIGRFLEVLVDCDFETLLKRDSSGDYKKAMSGKIPNFIGVTDPYEPPPNPELIYNSAKLSPQEGARLVLERLIEEGGLNLQELSARKRGGEGRQRVADLLLALSLEAQENAEGEVAANGELPSPVVAVAVKGKASASVKGGNNVPPGAVSLPAEALNLPAVKKGSSKDSEVAEAKTVTKSGAKTGTKSTARASTAKKSSASAAEESAGSKKTSKSRKTAAAKSDESGKSKAVNETKPSKAAKTATKSAGKAKTASAVKKAAEKKTVAAKSAGSKAGAGSKTAGSKTSAAKAAGKSARSKTAASKSAGSKVSGSKTSGSKTSGSKTSGSKTSGSKAASSKSTASKSAGTKSAESANSKAADSKLSSSKSTASKTPTSKPAPKASPQPVSESKAERPASEDEGKGLGFAARALKAAAKRAVKAVEKRTRR